MSHRGPKLRQCRPKKRVERLKENRSRLQLNRQRPLLSQQKRQTRLYQRQTVPIVKRKKRRILLWYSIRPLPCRRSQRSQRDSVPHRCLQPFLLPPTPRLHQCHLRRHHLHRTAVSYLRCSIKLRCCSKGPPWPLKKRKSIEPETRQTISVVNFLTIYWWYFLWINYFYFRRLSRRETGTSS